MITRINITIGTAKCFCALLALQRLLMTECNTFLAKRKRKGVRGAGFEPRTVLVSVRVNATVALEGSKSIGLSTLAR